MSDKETIGKEGAKPNPVKPNATLPKAGWPKLPAANSNNRPGS
jgi:hypothetical protein